MSTLRLASSAATSSSSSNSSSTLESYLQRLSDDTSISFTQKQDCVRTVFFFLFFCRFFLLFHRCSLFPRRECWKCIELSRYLTVIRRRTYIFFFYPSLLPLSLAFTLSSSHTLSLTHSLSLTLSHTHIYS